MSVAVVICTPFCDEVLEDVRAAALGRRPIILMQDAWQALEDELQRLLRSADEEHLALTFLLCVAQHTDQPCGVHHAGSDQPTTTFVRPLAWTEERLRGHIAGLWRDVSDELGDLDTFVPEGRLMHVHGRKREAVR